MASSLGKNIADFDIAFIEGAVTTKEHINLLKQIRETSKVVVVLGACAISGNIFAQLMLNLKRAADEILKTVGGASN